MSDWNHQATVGGEQDVLVEWMYPNIYNSKGRKPSKLTIAMYHVRASSNLVIEFDADRDGFVIRMDRTRDDDGCSEVVEKNVEVAFVPAWLEEEPG